LAGHVHRNIVLPKNATHPAGVTADLLTVGRGSVQDALTQLQAAANGLSAAEAARRRIKFGQNTLGHEKPPAWWYQLLSAFITPFTLILIVLALTSLVSDVLLAAPHHRDPTKVIIIGAIIALSGGIRFWQEFKSQKAAQELKNLVRNKTAVIRRSANTAPQLHMVADWPPGKEVPVADLVPGDIVRLSAGDMIPADVRIIWADDLYVSQSALTGESVPIEKSSQPGGSQADDPLELLTLCFTGTNVVSGAAVAVVVATGKQTYLGALAKKINEKRPLTSFDKGVNSVGWLLVRFMAVMVPIVFLVNGLTKGNWEEAFFFAVAVAVGLTPEILPMVVTANLAKGAIRMAKKKAIVKKLNAIQNFGAMDVLCTDKTGTLTENRIVLMRHLDTQGHDSPRVLELAYLNSMLQTGLKNLLDEALITYEHHALLKNFNAKDYKKVDEIPFDFTRRRMSVIVQNSERILICKGAVEELLKLSTHVEHDGVVSPITPERRKGVLQLTRDLNADGLRVIAVGYRKLRDDKKDYRPEDENNLILSGYIGFLDPPKPSARQALRQLASYGIETKIITGDNEIVTQKICRDVGFEVKGVLLGAEIQKLDDLQLAKAAVVANIFAKVDPLQKARIIAVLRSSGRTVGYMGDGVNDAAAMRQADVGVSVDSGVDIAKEAADIILLEHDLGVLNAGVIEGRTVFGNILKYIKMTASSNFGNVFSVVIASAFLPFLPMLPIQLLIQNLLYDISQLSIPWDNMDEDFLAKPRKWEATGIARFMFTVGPVSSLFDIATFAVMWFVFNANTLGQQGLFQSGWFVMGLVSQTLVIHLIRTQHIPFIQSRASRSVTILTVIITIIGLVLPFSRIGHSVGLQPLPLAYFGWLAALLFGYFLLVQLTKVIYIRRFKAWL
jgi:Mg2+-importing ATPase